MRHLQAIPIAAALLLTGCLPQPAAFQSWQQGQLVDARQGGQATLALRPRLAEAPDRTVLTVVPPYRPADVQALRLELYTVSGSESLVQTVDVPQASIGNTITFTHLKYATAYRVRAYALDGGSSVISTPSTGTVADLTTAGNQNDAPPPFQLTLQLKNKPFNGQGTATGFDIQDGGYMPYGFVSSLLGVPPGVLNGPYGVTQDDDGYVYVADTLNHCIRVIDPDGNESVLAGLVGTPGYSNGPLVTSSFNAPRGIRWRADSTKLYVADTGNHCIRVIDIELGTVTTLAGPTVANTPGFADGDAATVRFNAPQDLEVSREGHVLIADTLNHAIRLIGPDKVASDADFVVTIAGSDPAASPVAGFADDVATAARFDTPTSVVSGDGMSLFVADSGNHRIRELKYGDLTVSTFAGGGTPGFADANGGAAQFNGPTGLTADYNGNLYVADRNNHRIRKITPEGDVTTFAGQAATGAANLPREQASFNGPVAVHFHGNNGNARILVTDQQNTTIRVIR